MSEFADEGSTSIKPGFVNSFLASKHSFKISILLTSISVLLWAVSIIQAKRMVMDDYGLFSILPITYYAAVFLLLASIFLTLFCSKGKESKRQMYFLFFQSFLLMLFILFTPSLIEGFARCPHSWSKYSYADYIVRNGHMQQFGYYANTPMMFIFSAELVLLTGFDPFSFPMFFPMVLDLILFAFVVLFCLKFFNDLKLRVLAVVLFFIITWENQFHFVPQLFGFAIMILTIYLITFHWKKVNLKIILVTGMLIVVLIFTHLLTAFVACAYLGLTIIGQMLWSRSDRHVAQNKKRKKFRLKWLLRKRFWKLYWQKKLNKNIKWLLSQKLFFYSILVGIAVLTIWLYFSGKWVRGYNWSFSFSTIGTLFSAYIDKLYMGSDAHGNLVLLRMIFSATIALLAIIGGKMAYNRGQTRTTYLFLISGVIPIFLFNYDAEIVQRAFLFCGLPLAIMMAMGLHNKKFLALVLAFSFLAVPIHILAHYGNEKIDYTPASEIAGAKFMFDHVEEGFIIFGNSVIGSQYSEDFSLISIDYFLEHPEITEDVYLVFTSSSQYSLEWYFDPTDALPEIKQYLAENEPNLILYTPDCIIYKLN